MRIAFIGLGKMGLPIAIRLHGAGHTVAGYDVSAERGGLAAASGIVVRPGPDDVAADAEVAISSMPHDAALLEAVPLILSKATRSLTFVDTSTVSLNASQEVARICDERGVPYLRVALSGNPAMVAAGAVTTLSSGPPDVHRRIGPLLAIMGARDFYLGPHEEARVMKLIINHLVATTVTAVGEALAIGEASGLDRTLLLTVLAESAAGSPVIKAKAPALARGDFTPTFTVDQMRKDLTLIRDLAARSRSAHPVATLVAELLDGASARGLAQEDYAAVAKMFSPATAPAGEVGR